MLHAAVFACSVVLGGDVQHTFIDTDAVRYVYQPMEQLYLLLITNKQSNIMEDLETLRTVAKIVTEHIAQTTTQTQHKHMSTHTQAQTTQHQTRHGVALYSILVMFRRCPC